MNIIKRIGSLDSHHRHSVALGAGLITLALTQGCLFPATSIVAAWVSCALTALGLSWCTIVSVDPKQARRTARLQDASRTIIFVIVVLAACVSLLAVGFLLGPVKGLPAEVLPGHVLLSVLSVVASWLLMHTVFTLRYAHLYYGDGGPGTDHAAGLEFPEEKRPDYLDFAYFSFVIGMTCQVSDVQISSRQIRHLALFHGLLSFAFNTIILALSINIISGLL